jgi:diguanylate cyclase (GGDEF)-like protein
MAESGPVEFGTRRRRPGLRSRTRQGDHLAILNEIARIATEDLELQPMLQRVTDTLAGRFGAELVALVRIDQAGGRFVCEAFSASMPTEVRVGYGRSLGSGVVGEVAATGRSVLIDDVRRHANYVDTSPGTLAEVCVPVRHRGSVVAILNLESTRLAAFRGRLPLLETVAEQLSGVIAAARGYEETRRRAAHMEILSEVSRLAAGSGDLEAVLQRIAAYVRERLDLTVTTIALLAAGGRRYSLEATAAAGPLREPAAVGVSPSVGVVGRALRAGEPTLVLDVHGDPDYRPLSDDVVAEYVVPINFHGRLLGVFDFEAASTDAFVPESCRFLRLLADQVAGVLHLAEVNRRLTGTKRKLQLANQRLRDVNRALGRLALVDDLTHVSNRRAFDRVLESEWRRAIRSRSPLSLLLIDLDCFKPLNDAYGHQRGDDCLGHVAAALRDTVRRSCDMVGRYGGDEFAVVLPDTPLEHAAWLAETARARVERLGLVHAHSPAAPYLTVSIGVATAVPATTQSAASLLGAADRALYLAKKSGRNRVCVAGEGDAPADLPDPEERRLRP